MANWSYSQLALYRDCPLKFKFLRIDKIPTPLDPRRGARIFLGHVLQRLMELFYLDTWWRYPGLEQKMRAMLVPIGSEVTRREQILWSDEHARQEVLTLAERTIPALLRAIRKERLLGVKTLPEYDIHVPLVVDGVSHTVHGRADFLFEAADGALTLLDGKSGAQRGKYVDPDQPRLYALGVLADPAFQRLPDRLGFWWFRFGNVQWRPVKVKALAKFAEGVKQTIRDIRARTFDPAPGSHCRYCEARPQCPVGRAWLLRNAGGKAPMETGDQNLTEVSLG